MKKIIIKFNIVLVCLLLSQTSWSQLENTNWYFGDHTGLNFNGPISILNGQTPSNISKTASISDTNGNLLFYTDGHFVWDSNGLINNSSDSFSGEYIGNVLIAGYPNDKSKYLIFTSVKISYQNYKIYYSVVNVNGNANVEILNQPTALPNTPFNENLTIGMHEEDDKYWLVCFTANNTISSLLIDENGPSNTINNTNLNTTIGNFDGLTLKFSSDFTKLAFATYDCTVGTNKKSTTSCTPMLYIFDFNKLNGEFVPYFIDDTNQINIDAEQPQSVAFSENGNFLYILSITDFLDYGYYYYTISQFNLSTNSITFQESNFNGEENYQSKTRIMRAINGKIYIPNGGSYSNKLSVVNNPNNNGNSCNFIINEIDLSNGSTFYLPYLVPKLSYNCPENITITENFNSTTNQIISAENEINASNIIFENANIEYKAGQTISLIEGFHAKHGSNFRAFIEGCQPTLLKGVKGVKQLLSVKEVNSKNEDTELIKLYPNPTKGVLTIESTKDVDSWIIADAYGKSYYRGNHSKTEINMYNLPKGIYFLKAILNNGKVVMKKVVKN